VRETVLEAYQRLDAEPAWRPDHATQARNVVVSIGEATLTISDLNDVALAHWSLPAMSRNNPGRTPAIFSIDQDAPETLEVNDPEMIDALERVMKAVRKGGGRRGSVRLAMTTAIVGGLCLLVALWLPGALARYAAGIVPEATRASLGARLMGHVETLTGATCDKAPGDAALLALERRLFPRQEATLSVVPSALSGARMLPGDHILLSHRLVEDYETPSVAGAYAAEQAVKNSPEDTVVALLTNAGPVAVMRLLTTGDLPDAALRRHAEVVVGLPLEAVDIAAVAPRLADAGLSVDELADAVQGEAPATETTASTPALSDGEWIALQSICAR